MSTPTTALDARALDELCVNTIRTLSMDAVQKANSGHPGTPMALAPIAYVLYTRVMRHSPEQPGLARPRPLRPLLRPRVDAPLLDALPDRLRAHARRPQELPPARQPDRRATPSTGTPPGIETTTGPLGQGISMRVGMALAERMLAARFNRDGHELVDHHTFTIASDGDMEEGISAEAALAGRPPRPRPPDRLLRRQPHLDRGRHRARLLRGRRRALRGLRLARAEPRRGHRASTASRRPRGRRMEVDGPAVADHLPHPHRARLRRTSRTRAGRTARRSARRRSGSPRRPTAGRPDEPFYVPDEALAHFRECVDRGAEREAEWAERPSAYAADATRSCGSEFERDPERAAARRAGTPTSRRFDPADAGMIATRKAAQRGDPVGRRAVPELVGGSADLAPSTLTLIDGGGERRARRLRRAQPPLRDPRARDGRDRQRAHAARLPRLRRRRSSSSPTT